MAKSIHRTLFFFCPLFVHFAQQRATDPNEISKEASIIAYVPLDRYNECKNVRVYALDNVRYSQFSIDWIILGVAILDRTSRLKVLILLLAHCVYGDSKESNNLIENI